MLSVALVHNWPGKKNSELDIIVRVLRILESFGHQGDIIDPVGQKLHEDGQLAGGYIDAQAVDLVLNFHYTNPKWLDALSYCVNWNPLEYVLDDPFSGKPVSEPHLVYLMDCMRSHDRLLSAGSTLLDQFGEQVRRGTVQHVRALSRPLTLHTTMQAALVGEDRGWVSPVNADTFCVFYIGTNWEKTNRSLRTKVRHQGLFERLGESGRFRFYGLKKQNGIELWKGVEGYRGELPFDGGQSIISESRRCGVSLVPSSRQHLRSGVVSTRVFQACAAGVVIISDRNPFVESFFGDSVLYFDYGKDSDETAESILEQVAWIETHWGEAVEKAERAQSIFLERFALEEEVAEICDQTFRDMAVERSCTTANADLQIKVHYLIRHYEESELRRFIGNIACQRHRNVSVSVYYAAENEAPIKRLLQAQESISFDIYLLDAISLRAGNTLGPAAAAEADFHVWYSEGHLWQPGHISTLLRACVAQKGAKIAYSPFFAHFTKLYDEGEKLRYFIKGLNGGCRRLTERSINALDMVRFPLGNMLVAREALREVSENFESWALYDLLAPFLLLQKCYRGDANAIVFSPVITTHFLATEKQALNFAYSEYDHFPEPWKDGRERDRQLHRGFTRGVSVVSAADDELTVAALNQQFSVLAYLMHVFSGWPRLQGLLQRIQRLASRVF